MEDLSALSSTQSIMRQLFRRFVRLPGSVFGVAALISFASTQVWAQAVPTAAKGGSSETVPSIDGKLRNLVITGPKGDSLEITYANTGTVSTAIAGEVQVFVSEDEIVATVPFADARIIKAGTTQRFRVAMPKLAKGRYTLIAIVEYGGETMTAAQATLDMR